MGCGRGDYGGYLLSRGTVSSLLAYIGVDISETLEKAKKYLMDVSDGARSVLSESSSFCGEVDV